MKTFLTVLVLIIYSTRRIDSSPNAQDIPEGPTLAPLNYDALPEYVRNIVSTENPISSKASIRSEHSRGRILGESSKSNAEPKRRINLEADNILHNKIPKAISAGSWGTNLRSGNGYMWNINTLVSTEKSTLPTERRPFDSENSEVNTEENYTEDDNDTTPEWSTESTVDYEVAAGQEEGFPPGTWGMRLSSGDGYIWNDLANHSGLRFHVGNTGSEDAQVDVMPASIPSKKMEESLEDSKKVPEKEEAPASHPAKEKPQDEKKKNRKEGIEDAADGKGKDPKPKGVHRNLDDVNPFVYEESFNRLAENEPFWRWLENSTSSYVKTLVERVLTEVKDDLTKRKQNDQPNHSNDQNETIENSKNSPSMKPNDKTEEQIDGRTEEASENTTDEKPRENIINMTQTSKPLNNSSITNNEDRENHDQNEPKPNIDKYQSTRAPEIDLNDNAVSKNNAKHTAGQETDIKATVIYGNSVGNDKVTNVYIFYPRRPDEAVEQVRPPSDVVDSKNENETSTRNPAVESDSDVDVQDDESGANVKEKDTVSQIKENESKDTVKESGGDKDPEEDSREKSKDWSKPSEKLNSKDDSKENNKSEDGNEGAKVLEEETEGYPIENRDEGDAAIEN